MEILEIQTWEMNVFSGLDTAKDRIFKLEDNWMEVQTERKIEVNKNRTEHQWAKGQYHKFFNIEGGEKEYWKIFRDNDE